MTDLKRVLLIIPPTNDFYFRNAFGLKRAFERAGWRADILTTNCHFDHRDVFALYAPDVIMTINDGHTKLSGWPSRAVHICWMQDHAFAGNYMIDMPKLPGDLVYFCTARQRLQFRSAELDRARVLAFAADPEMFGPGTALDRDDDVSVIASMFDADRIFGETFEYRGNIIRVGELAELYRTEALGRRRDAFDHAAVEAVINRWLQRNDMSRLDYEGLPTSTRLLCDELVPRGIDRWLVVRELFKATNAVALYGPDAWKTWPDMAPYHRYPLNRVEMVGKAYHQSKLCLHNGGYMGHPRMIEGMACGAVMLANADAWNEDGDEGVGRLEPWEHFVPYERRTLSDTVKTLLSNAALRRKISTSAARFILDHHTWDHRVDQILADLGQKRQSP